MVTLELHNPSGAMEVKQPNAPGIATLGIQGRSEPLAA
jgi:hypothetical protein